MHINTNARTHTFDNWIFCFAVLLVRVEKGSGERKYRAGDNNKFYILLICTAQRGQTLMDFFSSTATVAVNRYWSYNVTFNT